MLIRKQKIKYVVLICLVLFCVTEVYSQGCTPLVFNPAVHSLQVNSSTLNLNIETDFCASGNGVSNDMAAFEAASSFISARTGTCKLTIPNGTYRVGRQIPNFSGYYSYGLDVLNLINVNNVEITGGSNSKLLFNSGLKFGSFDPATGERYDPPASISNFQELGFAARIGHCINIFQSHNITIRNLQLDGNFYANQVIIGGRWGDKGIQLKHSGINIEDSGNISADNITAQNFGLDGLYIGCDQNSPNQKNIHISNFKSLFNSRQGCSITGGDLIVIENSSFSETGRGLFTNVPASGLNIEPNPGVGRILINSKIKNCKFLNNYLNGIEYVNARNSKNNEFSNCFVDAMGGLFAIALGTQTNSSFSNCKFYGVSVDQGNNAKNESEGSVFRNCLFSDCYSKFDATSSSYISQPLVQITRPLFFGFNLSHLKFEKCVFNAFQTTGGIRLSNSATGGRTVINESILNAAVQNVVSTFIMSGINLSDSMIRNFLCRYDDINNCTFNNVTFEKWENSPNTTLTCE